MKIVNKIQNVIRYFAPHAFQNKVIISGGIPHILVTPEAYNDMAMLVGLANTEVGWIGTVEKLGNTFLIKEIFLLDQYAAPTTTEISSESLANWANELMTSRGDGMDIVNSIRFWGHSHVHMPTSPSYQDDTQMRTFASDCDDFFIRGILNKLGRMEFTIYLFDKKLEIHDAAWSIYVQDEDNARRERWQAEINAKVKDMYFPTPGSYGRKGKKKYAGFPKDEFPEFPGYENMQDEAGFYNSGYRFNSTNPNDSEL